MVFICTAGNITAPGFQLDPELRLFSLYIFTEKKCKWNYLLKDAKTKDADLQHLGHLGGKICSFKSKIFNKLFTSWLSVVYPDGDYLKYNWKCKCTHFQQIQIPLLKTLEVWNVFSRMLVNASVTPSHSRQQKAFPIVACASVLGYWLEGQRFKPQHSKLPLLGSWALTPTS